jgi:hypothetical protein
LGLPGFAVCVAVAEGLELLHKHDASMEACSDCTVEAGVALAMTMSGLPLSTAGHNDLRCANSAKLSLILRAKMARGGWGDWDWDWDWGERAEESGEWRISVTHRRDSDSDSDSDRDKRKPSRPDDVLHGEKSGAAD